MCCPTNDARIGGCKRDSRAPRDGPVKEGIIGAINCLAKTKEPAQRWRTHASVDLNRAKWEQGVGGDWDSTCADQAYGKVSDMGFLLPIPLINHPFVSPPPASRAAAASAAAIRAFSSGGMPAAAEA